MTEEPSRRLRIALLTYSTRPRGGVVHTLALAEALVAAGHAVDVWTLVRGDDAGFFRPVDPRVRLWLVPFPDREGEAVGDRILRSIDTLAVEFAARTPGYDVVHAQDCISANAVPGSIRTIHHLDTFTTPALAACHERAIVEPIGHICVSAAVAAEVEAGWGLRPIVIPNGVDADRFAGAASRAPWAAVQRATWREQLGRYVLAVGGIEPRKGTTDLIDAMAVVQRHRPDLKLVIAGGETLFDYRDYRDDVMARVNRHGVQLVVLGTVDHLMLPSLVAEASVFAFPSTKEGFGMAALEAMAAGVPVVMRDLPVLREVFDGAARFVTSPDALAAGILAAAMGSADADLSAGLTLARRFTWRAAAAAHVAAYLSLKPDLSVITLEPNIGATMS